MGIIEVIILAVSLSMDAFAVALCKGLALRKLNIKSCLIVGAWFGAFQGLMPLLGYLLGSTKAIQWSIDVILSANVLPKR